MKTLLANRKYFVLILVVILMGFGIQSSYGQTITASVQQPLTEANLHGSIVTLTLSGGTYERSSFTIERALMVSGIDGVTIADFFGVDRVSDTEVTVELEFTSNIDANGTLTFTVGGGRNRRIQWKRAHCDSPLSLRWRNLSPHQRSRP